MCGGGREEAKRVRASPQPVEHNCKAFVAAYWKHTNAQGKKMQLLDYACLLHIIEQIEIDCTTSIYKFD